MSKLADVSIERFGETVVASVSGEIDFSVAEDVGTEITDSIDNEAGTLILDLTRLTYTDSAGINLVFDLAAKLRERRQTLRIVLPMDSQPFRTFAIVGVENEIPVFETLDEAKVGGEKSPER